MRRRFRVLGVRNSQYLNWRYLATPRRRQIPFAARSSGRLIGVAALEVFRDRAEIIDLFTFAQDEYLDGVLNALIAKAREKGCCVLTATCMSGSLLSRHLRSRGFRAAESEGFQSGMVGDRPCAYATSRSGRLALHPGRRRYGRGGPRPLKNHRSGRPCTAHRYCENGLIVRPETTERSSEGCELDGHPAGVPLWR